MGADRRPGHVLHYAILASLALHAAALLVFPDPIDSARHAVGLPPPLVARLLEPEPAPVPVPVPAPPPLKPEPRVVQRVAPVEKKTPAAPRITTPAPEATAQAAPEPQPAPAVEPQPAPPPLAPSVAPPVAAAKPSTEPPEALSRDRYRLQLIGEARRHKRYPPLARENNWQGGVLVAVNVGANGRASVDVKASSGYEVLDRQALEMFGQAARSVPVPPALRGKPFALEVRAVYGLED